MEWVNSKRIPFWETMKRSGPCCETKEQKSVIKSQLNTYYKTFCKACILKDSKCSTCSLVKVKKFQMNTL